MRPLDPIVRAVAEHYGCSIEWCNKLSKWIIKREAESCLFYWCDLSTTADFFAELEQHFREIGASRVRYY